MTQDAWIAIILGAILAILFSYYPIAGLGKRFLGQSLVQICEKILGKALGKLFGFIIVYYLFMLHCWTLRSFGDLMVTVRPEIPIYIYIAGLSLATAYAVKSGLEVFCRCGEWLFPLGLFSLFLIIAFNIPHIEFKNMLPLMESKLTAMFGASIRSMMWFTTGSLMFGILLPFMNKPKDLKKTAVKGIGVSCFILFSFSIINIAVFGAPFTKVNNFQLLNLAQYAKLSDLLQRFESLLIMVWITWIFMRTVIFSYSALQGLCHLLHIKDYRFLVFPETLLAIAYSIYIYESFQEMSHLYTLDLYYLFYSAAIPCFLWFIAVIRIKFGKLKPTK